MRLRRVTLTRYRQFIDEILRVDPHVTVVVGRNDTGKTGLLKWFFDQPFYEGAIHGRDRPNVESYVGAPLQFSLLWDVAPEDYDNFPLASAFGVSDIRALEVTFQEESRSGEDWGYVVNGKPFSAYIRRSKGEPPVLRDGLTPRYLFPMPHYIHVQTPVRDFFEARFFDPSSGGIEAERIRELIPVESLLLRLGGLRAETRPVGGRGTEEPWPAPISNRTTLTLQDLDDRLAAISARISEHLSQWWRDPLGLQFRIYLPGSQQNREYNHRQNSHGLVWEVFDAAKKRYSGAGLLWFVTFLVELLYAEDQKRPLLLLFDEPANPLHPSAQRTVASLLSQLSQRHQLIYSTHSPFMIDWNFPQRIRLLRRDPATRRTAIDNAPYRPNLPFERIWDPLRETIGVTTGDVSILGEANVLVEGVVDQILMANVSALMAAMGRPNLDLSMTSLVPYGEEPVLRQFVSNIRTHSLRLAVLTDADQQGMRIQTYCRRENVPYLSLAGFADRTGVDFVIEDVVGVTDYVNYVNAFYSDFSWFRPLNRDEVVRELREESLGRYMAGKFERVYQQNFSKVSIAVFIVENLERMSGEALDRFGRLIKAILTSMGR